MNERQCVNKLYSIILLCVALVGLPACDRLIRQETATAQASVTTPHGIVIDTLSAQSYKEAHISGATSMPFLQEDGTLNPAFNSKEEFEKAIQAALNVTLNASMPIYVYCSNDACTTSDLVAETLQKFGFNAHPYKNGLDGWVALHLYSDHKDQYGVTPAIKPGQSFVYAPYLNGLVAARPQELTTEKLKQLEDAAQPLVEALKA